MSIVFDSRIFRKFSTTRCLYAFVVFLAINGVYMSAQPRDILRWISVAGTRGARTVPVVADASGRQGDRVSGDQFWSGLGTRLRRQSLA